MTRAFDTYGPLATPSGGRRLGLGRRRLRALLVAFGTVMGSHSAASEDRIVIDVDIDPNLRDIAVSVSAVGQRARPLARRLVSRSDRARALLRQKQLQQAVLTADGIVATESNQPIRYQVRLPAPSRRSGRIALSAARFQISDWADWLWLPAQWSAQVPVRLRVVLPAGTEVSLPFERAAPTERHQTVFHLRPTLLSHEGRSIIGPLQHRRVLVPGGAFDLYLLSPHAHHAQRYLPWVEQVARTVADVHGRAPAPASQIVIGPAAYGNRSPVPWGHVLRGGGSAVLVYPNDDAPLAKVHEDWTLYHEFAHLYHPYLGDRGRWLGEGLASYYQNVYRTRAGIVSAGYAWQRLTAGFDRARAEVTQRPGRSVQRGGLMRTYWTGAALALAMDANLRSRRLAARTAVDSLDGLLARFAQAELPSDAAWTVSAYMTELDALAGGRGFAALARRYAAMTEFPSVETVQAEGRAIMRGQFGSDRHSAWGDSGSSAASGQSSPSALGIEVERAP